MPAETIVRVGMLEPRAGRACGQAEKLTHKKLIPLKSNLKFNKSYDLIIATEPTGKREGGWILVMDKQKGKKTEGRGGWGRERC